LYFIFGWLALSIDLQSRLYRQDLSVAMSQILALAQSISKSAAVYEESLRKAGLSEPAFTPDGILDYPPTPPGLIEAKESLLTQIDELRRSVVSPTEVLRELPKSVRARTTPRTRI
jgi:hypothetical protein